MHATQHLNPSQQQGRIRKSVLLSLRYLVCGVIAFFVLIPIVTAIIGGFKSNAELASFPFSLPTTLPVRHHLSWPAFPSEAIR